MHLTVSFMPTPIDWDTRHGLVSVSKVLFGICASVFHCTLYYLGRGGIGRGQDYVGENGTVTGKACPKGLYGIFCQVTSLFQDFMLMFALLLLGV